MTAEATMLAKRCATAMWATDKASQSLGMKLIDVSPGRSEITMMILDSMVNGHGMCHGGFIFTLADSAFAFACNSHNQRTVAQHCSVTFVKSAKLGDRLIAKAVERSRSGRSGIYDITVTNADSDVIAEFRGHSRTIDGTLV